MTDDHQHTPWSDPGRWQARLSELPSDLTAIPEAMENILIHHGAARAMGIGVPERAESDRDLRSLERIISVLVERDDRPLSDRRDISNYVYGTCHDFALLATGILREHRIPARLRVGYAGYFIPGKWEDHWVCEYHTGSRWVLFDAELGPSARKHYKIGFPSADIPEGEWRSAGSVWHSIRAGTVEPTVCGVNAISIHGRWFVASAVLRDAAALAGIECLPWDYWGPGRDFRRTRQVIEEEAKQIDALAEALYPAPANRDEAEALLGRFPWARPRETVESIVLDRPVEVPILPMS